MKSRIVHIALFLSLLAGVRAQTPVTISGSAPFAAGEELRLLVYNDLLNGIPSVVTTDIVDKNGHFSLKYRTTDIKLAQIAIRNAKAEFFIVPANDYSFTISMDSALFQLINPEKYGGFLQIENARKDTADLNYKINRFSRYFNSVADEYAYPMIYGSNNEEANYFDTVHAIISEHFNFSYNPTNFYEAYGYYTLGTIDLLQYRKKPLYLYEKYFDNDYILYYNPAYMALFNQYYENYLYTSPHISKDLLTRTINEDPDYPTLFNEAGRDPRLANARLRELVIIKNLIGFLDNPEFDRGQVLKLLDYIRKTSSFDQHIALIDNTLNHIKQLSQGQEELAFLDEKGHKVRLKQYHGTPVYLHIFQTDCINCIREMLIIKELQTKYADKIQFVSLCTDPDKKTYQAFTKQFGKQFDWPVLYFDGQYDWLMQQGVETLPDHILIGESGSIIMRYAPAPEQGLPEYLQLHFPEEVEENDNPLFQNRNKQ